MTSQELRQKYLDFFKAKEHAILPSAPLIPENDPTVLFTTAGMHPLIPYLLGEKHPGGKRLVSCQKCVRTGDIDEVGDTTHHTFFEMLGNWSLGDYFKKEAIEWSFEFLTKQLNIPVERLAVSVFAGDKDAPLDQESIEIWKRLGIPESRIAKLSKEDNWWGPVGETGPCGPDTEMFYWADAGTPPPAEFNPRDKKWVEIWNDVFMEYNKTMSVNFEALKQKNVDTGMGLERTLAAINGLDDDYKTELFSHIINEISRLSGKKYDEHQKEFRIIADHLKTAVFMLAEKLVPSNKDQGYVMRRLIRRAIRIASQIGIKEMFTDKIAMAVISVYRVQYHELMENKKFIIEKIIEEEERFSRTLERGLKEFRRLVGENKMISGEDAFNLYQTYGFPIEITKEMAMENSLDVNEKEFQEFLNGHKELSRTAGAGRFKGGLIDNSDIATKYHTATHLLLAALRRILGNQVYQCGCNITTERLRFDFSHPVKVTPEQLREVEILVNEKIEENLPIKMAEMSLSDAKKHNVMGVFESRYGNVVKVYTIGDPLLGEDHVFSREICGGPHVERTGVLGSFKILKEESVSSGVRRIKAVLE